MLLASVDVLDAVALVFEGGPIGANPRHPAAIFTLILVGRNVAAETRSAGSGSDQPWLVGNVSRDCSSGSARIAGRGGTAWTIPPVASAIDIERRECRAQRWINRDAGLRSRKIEIVVVDLASRERAAFFAFEPDRKGVSGWTGQIADRVTIHDHAWRICFEPDCVEPTASIDIENSVIQDHQTRIGGVAISVIDRNAGVRSDFNTNVDQPEFAQEKMLSKLTAAGFRNSMEGASAAQRITNPAAVLTPTRRSITFSVRISSRRNRVATGLKLVVLSRSPRTVTVKYLDETPTIPIDSTDLR
jgi:hypothetical protein